MKISSNQNWKQKRYKDFFVNKERTEIIIDGFKHKVIDYFVMGKEDEKYHYFYLGTGRKISDSKTVRKSKILKIEDKELSKAIKKIMEIEE